MEKSALYEKVPFEPTMATPTLPGCALQIAVPGYWTNATCIVPAGIGAPPAVMVPDIVRVVADAGAAGDVTRSKEVKAITALIANRLVAICEVIVFAPSLSMKSFNGL